EDMIEIRNPPCEAFVQRLKIIRVLIPHSAQNAGQSEAIRSKFHIWPKRDRLGNAVCIKQEQSASSQSTEGSFRVSGAAGIFRSYLGLADLAFAPGRSKEEVASVAWRGLAQPGFYNNGY